MSLDLHRRAEALMGHADRLAAEGKTHEAANLYREAAHDELLAFDAIPEDRQRTRGIIAISVVALLCKANAVTAATDQARHFLERHNLPEFARTSLEALVSEPLGRLRTRRIDER